MMITNTLNPAPNESRKLCGLTTSARKKSKKIQVVNDTTTIEIIFLIIFKSYNVMSLRGVLKTKNVGMVLN